MEYHRHNYYSTILQAHSQQRTGEPQGSRLGTFLFLFGKFLLCLLFLLNWLSTIPSLDYHSAYIYFSNVSDLTIINFLVYLYIEVLHLNEVYTRKNV